MLFTGTNDFKRLRPTAGGELTIGSGVLVHGARGAVGESGLKLINQGTILADSGQRIDVAGTAWENQGLLRALSGTVRLEGTWMNLGTIQVDGGDAELSGSYQLADFGTITGSGGTVTLTGQFDNTGTTLDVGDGTLSWRLSSATVTGGTITDSGGVLTATAASTLDGVRLDADLVQNANVDVTVLGGLDLNGVLTLSNTPSSLQTDLNFPGPTPQTLSSSLGTGEVLFTGTNDFKRLRPTAGGELTIGSGVLVHGARGTVGEPGLKLVNQGTILADSGQQIDVAGTAWENQGQLEAATGTLRAEGTWTNLGVVRARATAVFTCTGDYLQSPVGVLELELAGTGASSFSSLDVSGSAALDGHIQVQAIGGFTPSPGNAFSIITAASISGTFATTDLPAGTSLGYSPVEVTLTAP